ncbi:unnamed protein product [Protopolystoma xenopodis]|uniref:Uncharacterized protein n=1 Tax=Protopolystoma xenopodis TaxID=117903 RepID=A0A3S5B048_9PLAT|nr:unnamed protein product [Protopolystoma xenopodis]
MIDGVVNWGILWPATQSGVNETIPHNDDEEAFMVTDDTEHTHDAPFCRRRRRRRGQTILPHHSKPGTSSQSSDLPSHSVKSPSSVSVSTGPINPNTETCNNQNSSYPSFLNAMCPPASEPPKPSGLDVGDVKIQVGRFAPFLCKEFFFQEN